MNVYDFKLKNIDGIEESLGKYMGKVLLIVNVASKCGFTPQYTGLEELYTTLNDKGFEILGFPCNQFGKQEPGSEEDIKNFCATKYNVTFPLFSKIEVNGPNADPLYKYLKAQKKGILGSDSIKWNFTKFLVDRSGNVLRRFASKDTPEKIKPEILKYL